MADEHHYVFGETEDFLTGEVLTDTHDERYRQKIARILVEEKGYAKEDVRPRLDLMAQAGENRRQLMVDFAVSVDGKTAMIIRYAPGSLITRHRPCIAAARLLEPYQVPFVVVTNGEDAQVLDVKTGKVISEGLDSIPDKAALEELARDAAFDPIDDKRREMESRIIYTYEAVGACNCDIC
ncbi:type I restriction enzyme HsdR N-terminal domain-containing protein [Desulfatibacillum aliphaticivorans]|uniref:type I restriction enzyme HsdR N-terminal domain-containing protein n=1 Tax=Desulfatibacillum aliphaticivorans TaxID=218208 RepID=UPI0003FD1A02|nr:type I restriction enzyme HsdR N-terminal domain-containing protein [Desulfatibacillum aliphaticivorans]